VNIHSILNLNKKKNKELNIISFKYFALNNKSVTSNMVVSYIITKLLQKYTFFETIRPISKELGFNTTLDGFKIKCSGRLTKTERASVSMQQFKRVSLSTVDAKIDYAFDYVRLKNSVCGIKV
jgi:ribosomal protein S3